MLERASRRQFEMGGCPLAYSSNMFANSSIGVCCRTRSNKFNISFLVFGLAHIFCSILSIVCSSFNNSGSYKQLRIYIYKRILNVSVCLSVCLCAVCFFLFCLFFLPGSHFAVCRPLSFGERAQSRMPFDCPAVGGLLFA